VTGKLLARYPLSGLPSPRRLHGRLAAGQDSGDRGTSDNLTSDDLAARFRDLPPACHVRREIKPVRPAAHESGRASPTFFRAA
jgi:hypothetical protein